ncbi:MULTISPECIES: YkvA family protein [unclassified Embleya]|uniref:YkvA family protein n=1 Tax=unclassified Embleya TaxID=2699296 RepID=UPI003675D16D
MDTRLWILIGVAALVFVVTLVIVVVLVRRLWRTWRLVRGPDASTRDRALFLGALIYAISPVDLLPDPILIDDIAVLLYALRELGSAGGVRTGVRAGVRHGVGALARTRPPRS